MAELNETNQDIKCKAEQGLTWNPIEELDLKINPNDQDDYQQLAKLLTNILTYPSTQAGELHMEANRLGRKDLRKEKSDVDDMKKDDSEKGVQPQYCPCCGYVKQQENINICTRLSGINNIGISTFLYFQTIKNVVLLLFLMVIIYSIYALATNLVASGKINPEDFSFDTTADVLSLSLASKQTNQTDQNKNFYLIQCWIGAGMVLVWTFAFFIMKYFEKEQEVKVEQETISASDFSIVIQGIPKDVTEQQLQQQFNQYQSTITNIPVSMKRPLKIAKLNIGKPFYLNPETFNDEQLTKLKDRHEELIDIFVGWIQQRQNSTTFSSTKQSRQQIYKQYAELLNKQMEKYKELSLKIEEEIQKESEITVTTIFVTFQTSHAMKLMAGLNDPSFLSTFRYYLTCCQGGNRFKFMRNNKDVGVSIERAPEPEDIIWANLGVSTWEIVKRKIITYIVTLILLGISFAAVYGLSQAQNSNSGNTILSFVISLVISLINVIIGQVIRRLSILEMDYTETKHQTSLALKSVLAQLVNSILIPMIVNFFVKQKIYESGGLASDIFMLGITNSLVTPALKIIDISFIINRFIKWYKCRTSSKLKSNQILLNDQCQYYIFEAGYEYIYIVNLFLFTCFFVSLQPIIAMFAFIGMGTMYWAQKYSIFNHMQRPVPGTDLINVAMWQIIYLGGILYAIGSLVWSNFMPEGIPKEALIPNLVALGIAVVMFVLPYGTIFTCIFNDEGAQCHEYSKSRILFSSQYDRLNPVTAKKGFEEYMKFLEEQQERYNQASEEEKKKIAEKFTKQAGRGQQKPMIGGMHGMPGMHGPIFGRQNSFMPPPQMMAPPHMRFAPPPGFNRPPQQSGPGFQPSPPQQPGFQQQQPIFQQPIQRAPPGFAPPGMGMRPGFPGGQMMGQPGFGGPQGFGMPPPGFGRPQGFGMPPPGFGMPPPGFGSPPPGFGR